jgi:gluconate 2-dehydrogenase gamma chain
LDLQDRRAFLRAAIAAGAAWAAADLVQVEDALAWAGSQAGPAGQGAIKVLTQAQADAFVALTSRIIPSIDGRPGAREAGVVYFIDRALSTFNAGQKKRYADGIADLDRRAAQASSQPRTFAALPAAEQDAVIKQIESSPFFQAVWFDTIVGTFALPTWGGNRDYAGWHMIGFEHQPRFQAPFGSYDADINRRG